DQQVGMQLPHVADDVVAHGHASGLNAYEAGILEGMVVLDQLVREPLEGELQLRLFHYDGLLRHQAAEATFLPLPRDPPPPTVGPRRQLGLPASAQWTDDLILLGMGEDGHVASLFAGGPASGEGLQIDGDKRCVSVPASRSSSAHPCVSLTLSSIAGARRVILAITGRAKRRTIERALSDDRSQAMPVSAVLRYARNMSVVWAP
ncbi:MAG: hypothetical protein EBS42_08060, partial [Caulobacteraceae bacterium]|nr:hypothetical protein [Caulobacteraceae bacterium]